MAARTWMFTIIVLAAWAAGTLAALASEGEAAGSAARQAASQPRRVALLVGCSRYPNLTGRFQLRGPVNDVQLTSELLQSRFGFAAGEITTLTDGRDEPHRPLQANIIREFERLVELAQEGIEIFILVAGHGSQQPDLDGDEADGLDEIFLPADIETWAAGEAEPRGITDDQFRDWLTAMRTRGASVFFVADTCHSGTMTRGPAEVTYRHVPLEEMVGPERARELQARAIAAQAASTGGTTRGDGAPASSADDALLGLADEPSAVASAAPAGNLVALYAVPASQLEEENNMPPPQARYGDPIHGRLTYALNHVLTNVSRPISYRELMHYLRWQYEQWRWFPSAQVEAVNLDREVLGSESWQGRSSIMLGKSAGGELTLDAGLLHGLTIDSVLRVFPPAGDAAADQVAGFVKVVSATATAATVEPCSYESHPLVAAEALPLPGRCEVAFLDMSYLQLVVQVGPYSDPANPAWQPAAEDVAQVRQIVAQLAAQPAALFRLGRDNEHADIYVLVAPQGVLLRRTFDALATDARTEMPLFGPYSLTGHLEEQLDGALTTVARAINLQRLAQGEQDLMAADVFGNPAVRVDVGLEKFDPRRRSFQPLEQFETLDLLDDDVIRITVTNTGREPVDVSVLYIESACRIRSYLPTTSQVLTGDFDNRVLPGSSISTHMTINDSTLGLEDLVVIATAADPRGRVHFSFLEQDGLTAVRGPSAATTRGGGVRSPLDALIDTSLGGVGSVRGGDPASFSTYAIRRLSWNVARPRAGVQPSP